MSAIIEDEYGQRREYHGYDSGRFIRDMERNGWPMEHYYGGMFYQGPAVRAANENELQSIIRATEVLVRWDTLGMGYIVFPGISDAGNELKGR